MACGEFGDQGIAHAAKEPDFVGIFEGVFCAEFVEDVVKLIEAAIEGSECVAWFFGLEGELGFATGAHHDDLRAELLHDGAVRGSGAVVTAEVEHVEVPGGVADDAGVIAQGEESDVAVVVVDGFCAKGSAFFGAEDESGGGAIELDVALEPVLLIFQERIEAVGFCTVGPSGELHLEDAEVDTHLQFFPAIGAADFSGVDASGFIGPGFQ